MWPFDSGSKPWILTQKKKKKEWKKDIPEAKIPLKGLVDNPYRILFSQTTKQKQNLGHIPNHEALGSKAPNLIITSQAWMNI